MKNLYGNSIPSLKETVLFLSKCDTPLGDLCKDMIEDENNIHWNDIDETWWYLNEMKNKYGNHLDEPIRRLKTIYSTIYKS
jgi:hypothetical protein